ncbi:MAG: DNA topoisomerase I, partial [Verrucomicrobiota bacterium]|nr:DNA topoisomerase I [Verrucomicrobiota bacterium]
IVSTLDQLEEKYDAHHPKTAYVKKGKFGKKKGEKGGKKKRTIAQPTYKASNDLAKIVGQKEISRPEATKKIWEYIKLHNLQDPINKRRIVPDADLAKIIGKEPIDMMKLSSFLSKHLKK